MIIDRELVFELLKLIPQVLWVVLVGIVLVRLIDPVRKFILPRIDSFDLFGVKLQLSAGDVRSVLSQREGAKYDAAAPGLVARADRLGAILRDARVLWVDDEPMTTVPERELLHRFGVFVQTARSTAEAFEWLGLERSRQMDERTGKPAVAPEFDIIVSDIARPNDDGDGLKMLAALRERGVTLPVILYITRHHADRGVPAGAFGITSHPDELFHLVMDILERRPPASSVVDAASA